MNVENFRTILGIAYTHLSDREHVIRELESKSRDALTVEEAVKLADYHRENFYALVAGVNYPAMFTSLKELMDKITNTIVKSEEKITKILVNIDVTNETSTGSPPNIVEV